MVTLQQSNIATENGSYMPIITRSIIYSRSISTATWAYLRVPPHGSGLIIIDPPENTIKSGDWGILPQPNHGFHGHFPRSPRRVSAPPGAPAPDRLSVLQRRSPRHRRPGTPGLVKQRWPGDPMWKTTVDVGKSWGEPRKIVYKWLMFHIYVSSQELYHETWRFYQISLRKMRTSTNKNDGFIYFMCFFGI